MHDESNRRRIITFLPLLILMVAAGFSAGWLLHPNTPAGKTALPVLGDVPAYTMTNQLGQSVSSTAFRGKIRVVTFLFPYCRGYCPLIAHNFVSLEHVLKISGLADRVQLIAFNVDTESTGPAQMKAFQQQYGWDPENLHWQYLTGSPDEIRRIVSDAYHVYFKKVVEDGQASEQDEMDGDSIPEPVVENKIADEAGVDYDIVHNDLLAIVDTQGRIRKLFGDADRVSDEQIIDVIYQLLPANNGNETR